MNERVQQFIENLPDDIRDQAKAATSREELKELLDNYDGFIPLTEEEMRWVSGGCSTEVYGDSREDFDSSRMEESFINGEDLGF